MKESSHKEREGTVGIMKTIVNILISFSLATGFVYLVIALI
jgi:hypothetical protein